MQSKPISLVLTCLAVHSGNAMHAGSTITGPKINETDVLKTFTDTLIKSLTYTVYVDKPSDDFVKGHSWPVHALSMGGPAALQNVADLLLDVQKADVPGDFVETGVWRGASGILVAKLLEAMGDTSRKVWNLDSYEWLPPPQWSQDKNDQHSGFDEQYANLKEMADIEGVKKTYKRWGIDVDGPNSRVNFVKGWFENTVPEVAKTIGSISILRMDGDMYKSTWEVFIGLYEKVSVGGWVIIDDWDLPGCRSAVVEFRTCIRTLSPLYEFTSAGHLKAYWQKKVHVDTAALPCYKLKTTTLKGKGRRPSFKLGPK